MTFVLGLLSQANVTTPAASEASGVRAKQEPRIMDVRTARLPRGEDTKHNILRARQCINAANRSAARPEGCLSGWPEPGLMEHTLCNNPLNQVHLRINTPYPGLAQRTELCWNTLKPPRPVRPGRAGFQTACPGKEQMLSTWLRSMPIGEGWALSPRAPGDGGLRRNRPAIAEDWGAQAPPGNADLLSRSVSIMLANMPAQFMPGELVKPCR